MEAKATAKYVRVTPRKARLVIDQVRGKDVVAAREILRFSERAIAEVVEKVPELRRRERGEQPQHAFRQSRRQGCLCRRGSHSQAHSSAC